MKNLTIYRRLAFEGNEERRCLKGRTCAGSIVTMK